MMNSNPKISIVTPSFNQAEFLEATIQSVLSQNYPNLEYIIIDGGSTDASVEIIKKYAEHITYWCSEPDAGQYDAINKGFRQATGEIMAWINSDDMYFPWTLKTVSSVMSSLSEVEWLTTLSMGGWDWDGFCTGFSLSPGFSREAFLDGRYLCDSKLSFHWIQQESTFWRRILWEKVGSQISTEYKLASDFDLWARFYLYAPLYGVDTPLGGFRSQNTQRSRQMEKYILEAQESLAKARCKANWTPNHLKEFALKLRLRKLPKIQKLLVRSPHLSYMGQRVVRKLADSPNAYWVTENSRFS